MQSALLVVLREVLPDPELFADAAERPATVFGLVSGAAIEALLKQPGRARIRSVYPARLSCSAGSPS